MKKGIAIPIGGIIIFLLSIVLLKIAQGTSITSSVIITLKGESAMSAVHEADILRKTVFSALPLIASRAAFEAGQKDMDLNRLDKEYLTDVISSEIEGKMLRGKEPSYIKDRVIEWLPPGIEIEPDQKYFNLKGEQMFVLNDKATGTEIRGNITFNEKIESSFFDLVDMGNIFFESSEDFSWKKDCDLLSFNMNEKKFNVTNLAISMKSPINLITTPIKIGRGSMPKGKYNFQVAAIDENGGLTLPSQSSECEIKDENNACEIKLDAVAGAVSYHIYNGTNSNTTSSTEGSAQYYIWDDSEIDSEIPATTANAFYETELAKGCKDKEFTSVSTDTTTDDCYLSIDNLLDFSLICGYGDKDGLAKLETLEGKENEMEKITEIITKAVIDDIKSSKKEWKEYEFKNESMSISSDEIGITFNITDENSKVVKEGTNELDALQLIYKSKTELR